MLWWHHDDVISNRSLTKVIYHHPITNPAELRCNSSNNKEIMEREGEGGGGFQSPQIFENKKAQFG